MKTQICFKCNLEKPLEDFYKHPQMPLGRVRKCKECNKLDIRIDYIKNREKKLEYDQYRNRYNIQRIFNHKYSGIKSRCEKLTLSGKKNSVFGKKYLSKEEWIKWCYSETNYKKFIELYNNWIQSNCDRKLNPSIDRVDNKKGYIITNLQWLTQSENSSKNYK